MREAMFDQIITVATAAGAIVQASITVVFFGTLAMVVLTSFGAAPMPY